MGSLVALWSLIALRPGTTLRPLMALRPRATLWARATGRPIGRLSALRRNRGPELALLALILRLTTGGITTLLPAAGLLVLRGDTRSRDRARLNG